MKYYWIFIKQLFLLLKYLLLYDWQIDVIKSLKKNGEILAMLTMQVGRCAKVALLGGLGSGNG
jgi:hypothetical protein